MAMEPNTLDVVTGSTYLHDQEQKYRTAKATLAWPVAILWTITVLAILLQAALFLFKLPTIPLWLPGILLALSGGTTLLLPIIDRLESREGNYARGRSGEEQLSEILAEHLGQSWRLYRNVVLPDGKGDVDAVLVGSKGVFALEVKAFSGRYKNEGDRWLYRQGQDWTVVEFGPTRQAQWNQRRLQKFLADNGIEIDVQPRVVWAGSGNVHLAKPAVPVWLLRSPAWMFRDLEQGSPLDETVVIEVRSALDTLVKLGGLPR